MSAVGTHLCPAPACERVVPVSHAACLEHWYALPWNLRRDVLVAARHAGSAAHREALKRARKYWRGDTAPRPARRAR